MMMVWFVLFAREIHGPKSSPVWRSRISIRRMPVGLFADVGKSGILATSHTLTLFLQSLTFGTCVFTYVLRPFRPFCS